MLEPTKAEKLAHTLNYLVKGGHVPGLLPRDVTEAAELLVAQEREIKTLQGALATKEHTVEIEIADRQNQHRLEIRGAFVITDPVIHFGEHGVDSFVIDYAHPDWIEHEARLLVQVATDGWLRDLTVKAYAALREAVADLRISRKRVTAVETESE